jgi:hypothetical protein
MLQYIISKIYCNMSRYYDNIDSIFRSKAESSALQRNFQIKSEWLELRWTDYVVERTVSKNYFICFIHRFSFYTINCRTVPKKII